MKKRARLFDFLNRKPRGRDVRRRELARFVRKCKRAGWSRARLAAWFHVSPRQLYRYLNGSSAVNGTVAAMVAAAGTITRDKITLGA